MGTCLVTPYLQDYDLVMSAFVAVWLKQAGQQQTRVSPTTIAAGQAAIMLAPFVAAPLAKVTGYVVATPALVAVFALVMVLTLAPSKRGEGLAIRA
jgi:hypothetical protein